ncbi:serine O-acetyltransferase [Petrocella sp. FN5]|uniref:serine O-acetyltransferase n=1 Tax=Petrocella sp. FN5 TaxID=3032002 RepID=UPI0023DAEB9F|nr:hypothetical protein [Petrocella sp. FN5]MDF1618121.1 hypothetical protein [Petrocella sp. FN5]
MNESSTGTLFVKSKEDLKAFLKVEKEKYNASRFTIPFFEFRERQILWRHNSLLRRAEYHRNQGHSIRANYYKLRLKSLQNKYGIHIPINCFDQGLKIMHLGPILVNQDAKIGRDCSIHINTSIVAGGRDSGVPLIGNNVVIGIGAVILGGIRLADYMAIGANAVVNKSFNEENITVAGVPAKKISETGRKEWNKPLEAI